MGYVRNINKFKNLLGDMMMNDKRFDLDDLVDKLVMFDLLLVSILSLIVLSYVILTILWG